MKLSTKLLIGLSGILLLMILISAFSMKTEFEKINQKDLYWDFKKLSVKPFKHLRVIGQKAATGKVNIIMHKNFAVNVLNTWATAVEVTNQNDTLIVRFLANPTRNQAEDYQTFENIVTVLCPNLNSIVGETTTIKIDSLNQQTNLRIEANKITTIDIKHLTVPQLDIRLDTYSNAEFWNNKSFKIDKLSAKIASGASLKMRSVYPKTFDLNASDKAIVEMNGSALKVVQSVDR